MRKTRLGCVGGGLFLLLAVGVLWSWLNGGPNPNSRVFKLPDRMMRFDRFATYRVNASSLDTAKNRAHPLVVLVQTESGKIVFPVYWMSHNLHGGGGSVMRWTTIFSGDDMRLPDREDVVKFLFLTYRLNNDLSRQWRHFELSPLEVKNAVGNSPNNEFKWPEWRELSPIEDRDDSAQIIETIDSASAFLNSSPGDRE